MGKLTALSVEKNTSTGRYADGDGLYLNISNTGTKSWLFRYQLRGARRWMGLGAYHKHSNNLAMARAEANAKRALLIQGIDPIEHDKQQQKLRLQQVEQLQREELRRQKTFKVCATDYIDKKQHEWTNEKHTQQWTNTLEAYVYPYIGDMPVMDIEIEDIRRCLDPIWTTKTETATRVRQRIEAVISYAIASKYRDTPNPATWRGLLDKFYPNPQRVKQKKYEQEGEGEHHSALPYSDMPKFMADLINRKGIGAKALRLAILTAVRSGELRFATWDEFNLKKKEWNIPKERMKSKTAHRVALSDAAVELLKALPQVSKYVFPGFQEGKPISDGAMRRVLKRMGRDDLTVHGFRSTFRDYIGEETSFPFLVAEYALAHKLKDQAQKAYARGDMLKKRFAMMNAWAEYVDSKLNN